MFRPWLIAALTIVAIAAVVTWSSGQDDSPRFTDDEIKVIASLSLSRLGPLPPDLSNRVGDDPLAATLGAALFVDTRLSASGSIACSSCHVPERGFDDQALPGQSVGVTTRRAMTVVGTAHSPWFFWDGRADSQWAQALGPLENLGEHALSRVAVVRAVAVYYASDYEAVFGALPDLTGLPADAGPLGSAVERAAWDRLSSAQQRAVNMAFANVGKAIAAFERTLKPSRGRFDDFADALVAGRTTEALSASERRGLALFVGEGQCTQCHNGPLLTDNFFHNTGVPLAADLPVDLGRLPALRQVDDDEFNCLGPYSDARPNQCGELRFKATGDALLRAFKTPSLRDVARRAPFMHAGQFATLDEVVAHYAAAPWPPIGASELHRPALSERERADLVAFLNSL